MDVDYLDVLFSSWKKSLKVDVVENGLDIKAEKRIIIPVTPIVDMMCDGFMEGTSISLFGPEKVGKTTLALAAASNAVKPEYGNRPIFYFDVEERFKSLNISSVADLDISKVHIIRSKPKKILTHVDYLQMALDTVKTVPNAFIIFDSLSAISNQNPEAVEKEDRGASQKPVTRFFNELAGPLRVNKCLFIGISHIISNTSGYGKSKVEKTSLRWLYQTDTKLQATKWEYWLADNKRIGKKVTWECLQAANKAPGQIGETYLRFGVGFDKFYEAMVMGIDCGIIEKSGAWYNFHDFKFHGEEKLYEFFKSDADASEALLKALRAVAGE